MADWMDAIIADYKRSHDDRHLCWYRVLCFLRSKLDEMTPEQRARFDRLGERFRRVESQRRYLTTCAKAPLEQRGATPSPWRAAQWRAIRDKQRALGPLRAFCALRGVCEDEGRRVLGCIVAYFHFFAAPLWRGKKELHRYVASDSEPFFLRYCHYTIDAVHARKGTLVLRIMPAGIGWTDWARHYLVEVPIDLDLSTMTLQDFFPDQCLGGVGRDADRMLDALVAHTGVPKDDLPAQLAASIMKHLGMSRDDLERGFSYGRRVTCWSRQHKGYRKLFAFGIDAIDSRNGLICVTAIPPNNRQRAVRLLVSIRPPFEVVWTCPIVRAVHVRGRLYEGLDEAGRVCCVMIEQTDGDVVVGERLIDVVKPNAEAQWRMDKAVLEALVASGDWRAAAPGVLAQAAGA